MTPFLAASGDDDAADGSCGIHRDFQQQHMRHSSPGFMNLSKPRISQAANAEPHLISHPSVIPGPSYPFPSEHLPGRPTGWQWMLLGMLKPLKRARLRAKSFTFLDWLQLVLPCVKWLRTYRIKEYLLWDIIAGISVGFMVVPQGMSYANIAGVPSVYGLYGAFLPVLVYSVFGSSRELAVGPVAVTSLLISSSLKEVVPGSADITNPNNPPAELVPVQEMYNHRAIQLSLLVACMYTAVGIFNLGFLTNFLSHSVIGGFTSGAAIIIGMSQLKYILGYSVPRADKLYEQVHLYIDGIQGFVWQEYIMGMLLLTMLLTIKYFGKRYPSLRWLRPLGPISACVVAIIAVVVGDLQNKGIKIVGHIPAGLPSPTLQWWMPLEDAASLAPLALVVMVVDLLESTSIARALAAKGKYELNANQEIVGLGLANFAGSAFNAYSTTGSFSRSAVNYDSGCKTALSGFVTGCVVGLVLLIMTPVFEKLPLNVMGAIVISGVSGLFEYEEAVHLFKVRKLDWCVWMCSFLSTMLLGVEIGLAISIGLALMIVIYESAFPHTALLGRVGRTTIYRNVKQFPDSQVIPGIAACRVDAAMYFANVAYIHERLRKYIARAEAYSEAAGTSLQYVLLDMSPVTHLDSTGAALLEKLHDELQEQGVQLGLCNPACGVVALLERTGCPDYWLGRDWIFVRMHDAIQTCLAAMISNGQAVRPLSAYDSTALTPRIAGQGPAPLLFHPPRRRSPTPHYNRPSTPGSRPSDHLKRHTSRRSFEDGGSSAPLLPHECATPPAASIDRQCSDSKPKASGADLAAEHSATVGATTDETAVLCVEAFAGGAPKGSSGGFGGGEGSFQQGSGVGWVRPESAPGFSSVSDVTEDLQEMPSFNQVLHTSHGCAPQNYRQQGQFLQDLQQQQQQSLLHRADSHKHASSSAGPVVGSVPVGMTAANAAGYPWQLDGAPHHTAAPGMCAATGPAGFPGEPTMLLSRAALQYSSGGSSPRAARPNLAIRTTGRRRSTDGGLMTGGALALCSASSGYFASPVTLNGLHLHISPNVLNHPAVSRSVSACGNHEATAGPLSSSSSFRRPVSPRTERMLDEVFVASNGDEELLSYVAPAAMLQLSEMSTEDTWGVIGLQLPAAASMQAPPATATERGSSSGRSATADAADAHPGEVRLTCEGPHSS